VPGKPLARSPAADSLGSLCVEESVGESVGGGLAVAMSDVAGRPAVAVSAQGLAAAARLDQQRDEL